MDDANQIRRILIVGGGTAGWMAAAYLQKHCRCQIALVESPDVPTVGVGEATLPALIDFVAELGLDEDDFMRRCHATYKLGIQFRDWFQPQHCFWHPFGVCGGEIDGIDLFHYWLKGRRLQRDESVYTDYSLQRTLAEAGRAHRRIGGKAVVRNYAYHLDAGAFADYLKEVATSQGVRHVLANVEEVVADGKDRIRYVRFDDGRQVDADLYLDCTGFQGLLIEQALGDPYLDWSDTLICDRAVVIRLPANPEMMPCTEVTGGRAGWIWRIPLTQRVGCGYVYSSRHLSDEEALAELSQFTGLARPPQDANRLTMRVGRRAHFWKGNCVSLGLASGFIEPLESTGIFLIQRALECLLDSFPDTSCSQPLQKLFNARMADAYEESRDFVLLHYYLSQRNDPFWKDARQVSLPDSLVERLTLFDDTGAVVVPAAAVFPATSFYSIYAGEERLPRTYNPRVDFTDFEQVCKLLDQIKNANQNAIAQLPRHQDLMRWLHEGEATSR